MSAWFLVPVVGTAVCWLVSLRRTPWPMVWLFACLAMAGIGLLEMAAVMADHHTLPGLIAASIGSVTPPLLAAGGTELNANDHKGIRRSREKPSKPRKPCNWTVIAEMRGNEVWVGVHNGGKPRWLGQKDPLTDMDDFMELRVKADQAAETLNALKIKAEGER